MKKLASEKTNIIICCGEDKSEYHKQFINALSKQFNVSFFKKSSFYKKTDTILTIGGDGTLNFLINNLNLKDDSTNEELPKILYYPDGTANDFAKSLNYPQWEKLSVKRICDIINKNSFIHIPIMKCNDQFFINVLTAGAPAQVTDSGNSMLKEIVGKFSYYLNALEEIISPTLYNISYQCNNEDINEVTTYGFLVSQGLYAGGGVKVNNSLAAHFDKYFNFTIPNNDNIASIITDMIELQKEEGKITEINSYNCEKLLIKTNKEIPIKLDGEEYHSRDLTIEKTKCSLPFYLP